jgi:hypothetical protein
MFPRAISLPIFTVAFVITKTDYSGGPATDLNRFPYSPDRSKRAGTYINESYGVVNEMANKNIRSRHHFIGDNRLGSSPYFILSSISFSTGIISATLEIIKSVPIS